MKTRQFPNHLRAWRKARGLSQAQLAEMLVVSPSAVGDMETGTRRLSPKSLKAAGDALGVSPGTLLDYAPEDAPIELLALWAKIPEANRARALKALKALVSP